MANPMYGSNKFDDNANVYGAGKCDVIATSVSYSLTPDDSGALVMVTPVSGAGANSITLPAHAAGLTYTIMLAADYDTAAVTVDSVDGNDWLGNIDAQTGAGDNSAASDDKVSFGSGTVAGDYVKIVSTGAKWVVVSSCSKVTTNGIAFG
jgi:hypothetical protein